MNDSARVPTSTPLSHWLAELAQPKGAPGGGAAAGVVLGLSAALLRMVAEYTPRDVDASRCADRLETRRAEALAAAEADGVQSARFGAVLGLPDDDPARDGRVRDAAIAAGESSARLGEVGLTLVPELEMLAEIGNRHLAADLAVAAEALVAGLAGAAINVRANLQTARRHGADEAEIRELSTIVQRLAAGRATAQRIAGDVSARLDE